MREERLRKILLMAGSALVIILLVIFIKGQVLSGKEAEAGTKELWSDVHDPSRPVYLKEDGTRVIQWEKIQIPDWITRDLLPLNEYSRPGTGIDDVAGVVVHYTANPGSTAEQNRNYFAGLADGSSGTYASSHFIIGIDGTVIQCVPMGEIAYASNERNHDTISIECCHEDESGKLTKDTYQSLVKLTAWLSNTYLIETDEVIRHYDVTGKICPKYFVDYEDKWEEFLQDVEQEKREAA